MTLQVSSGETRLDNIAVQVCTAIVTFFSILLGAVFLLSGGPALGGETSPAEASRTLKEIADQFRAERNKNKNEDFIAKGGTQGGE